MLCPKVALSVLITLIAAMSATTAGAQTVTLDFDSPSFVPGSSVGQVGDITFRPAATVFTPVNVVTFTGAQALKVAATCANAECTNNAYLMEIRLGQPLPAPAGAWLWRRADIVSMRIGADSIANSCFPEGTTCPIFARLSGFDPQDNLVADSYDVLLLDASSLSSGGYRAPITKEIGITDPQARIVRVVLVYGKHTFDHDTQPPFTGEPQIDHLVVNFPATLPTPGPNPPVPMIRIQEPANASQRGIPYDVRLRGSVTVPGGLAGFCYRVNAPVPSGNDCRNNTDLAVDDTFNIAIPDGLLGPGTNTLAVTVYDLAGQHTTQSVSLTALPPPPPAIIIYAPTNNQWIDPARTNTISGTVGTVGALKGFCVRIDAPVDPAPGSCVQDLDAIKSINTAWQPLFFTTPLAANRLTTGAHRISVFAVDRWDQLGRAFVDISAPNDFRIVGMEVTQGIQTFDIPLNINGVAVYNGVNLRVGVPTVVRVFANTAFAGSYSGVRMLLSGFVPDPRLGEKPLGSLLPDSSPSTLSLGSLSVPPSVRADPSSAFVFTLPTSWTQQNGLRLQAKLQLPFGTQECPTCATNNDFSVVSINFGPAIAIKIASVQLTFTDSVGVLHSPASDPMMVFEPTLNLLPTPASNVIVLPYAGTIDVSDLVGPVPMTSKSAPCRQWTSICEARIYSRMRIWESQHPQDADWLGVGPVDVGYTVAPIAIADSNVPITAVAHEFFHDLGYFHASGACGADLFIMWPPDEKGFIHGVGLDRRMNLLDSTGTWTGRYRVFMPDSAGLALPSSSAANYYDVMSYCATENNAWISVDNWNVFGGTFPNGLFPYLNAFSGTINSPLTGSASAPQKRRSATDRREDALLATALLELNGDATILSVAVVANKESKASIRVSSDYSFVARDLRGTEIARSPALILLNTGHHDEDGQGRILLSARMAAKDVASLAVEYKGKSIGERRRSKAAPSVKFASMENRMSTSRDGALDVKWVAADDDADPLEIRIEFSEGKDKPYRPLYLGANRGSWTIQGRLLATTTNGRLRIIANDGFNETDQILEPIVVTPAPPEVQILSPSPGFSAPDSTPIRLRAAAFGDAGSALAGDQVRWTLDESDLGTGLEVEVRNLKKGRHVAKATATEGKFTASKEIAFSVSKSSHDSTQGDSKKY